MAIVPPLALYLLKIRKMKTEYDGVRENVRYAFRTYKQRLDAHEVQMESLTRSVNDSLSTLKWLRGRVLGQERRIARTSEATLTAMEAAKRTIDYSLATEGRLKELELQVERGRDALKGFEQLDSIKRELSALAEMRETSLAPVTTVTAPDASKSSTSLNSEKGGLARLTETEHHVLDVLTNEGAKTSRELEKVVGRTREHTARIMKKLYLEGYVDRDTHKLPYVYRVNEKLRAAVQKDS